MIGQFVTPQNTAVIPHAAQIDGENPSQFPITHPTQEISDRYDRVVRILGMETVEDVVQQDIKEQRALEEKRRMEQMPKGSVLKQLEWATQKSQIENQQRKKNKTKYKGLEI